MKKYLKRYSQVENDAGLSLAEVLIAVGLTGLLALGCTQLALASFTSTSYTQSVAAKSITTGNAIRVVTNDMATASGFMVDAVPGTAPSSVQCSSVNLGSGNTGPTVIRALFTMQYSAGNMVGYEIRSATSGSGALWRVMCPTAADPSGPAQMLLTNLPDPSSSQWDNAVSCPTFTTPGTITKGACAGYGVMLNSITTSPGIIFTIPATNTSTGIDSGAQTIVAARNIT